MESSIILVDISNIEPIDLGGMPYQLKLKDILDGRDYQIYNASDLLIKDAAYLKCESILKLFGALA